MGVTGKEAKDGCLGKVGVGGLEDERVGGWKGERKGEGMRVERGRVGG